LEVLSKGKSQAKSIKSRQINLGKQKLLRAQRVRRAEPQRRMHLANNRLQILPPFAKLSPAGRVARGTIGNYDSQFWLCHCAAR
jgi:hypothetical protein